MREEFNNRKVNMLWKNWKVLGPLIVGSATVLGVAIAATNSLINYYRDQPRLHVSITANLPEYRFGSSDNWSDTINTTPIDEMVDLMISLMASSALEKNKLLIPGATKLLRKKEEKNKKKVDSLQVRIPILITVANNGRQPATIVTGKILIHGYADNKPVSMQLDNVRELIESSSVVDLKPRNIEFNKLQLIPDIIKSKIILGAMANKMASWNPSDKEWEHQVSKMIKGISQMMDIPDWEETQLKIEVELTDQFGTIIKNSTVLRSKLTSSSEKN